MNGLEFVAFTLEHWPALVSWSVFFMVILFFLFKEILPAKIYDPFQFYVTFNLGTGYAVLCSLYQYGEISNKIFFTMFFLAIVLLGSLYFFLKKPVNNSFSYFKLFFSPVRSGKLEFLLILGIYFLLTLLVVIQSGVGALADTNRFEQARGFGIFIRVLDFFRLIILAYLSIKLIGLQKWTFLKICGIVFIVLFLLFSSLVGGAKFAFLEGLFVIAVAISKIIGKIKLGITKSALLLLFSTIFALFVIYLGERNNAEIKGVYNDDTNVFIQKLAARILANGDSYYGSLPNDIIEKINTDELWIRFLSPVIGVSQTSKIVGYPVENFSVGRAILLYHDPTNDVSGGPVSHYDLFAYVYFGVFAFIFVIVLSYIITRVGLALNESKNIFYLAVMSAIWTRCLAILLEPTVGLAYILDAFILLGVIKIISLSVYSTSK